MIFLGILETPSPAEGGAVGEADCGTENMDVNQPGNPQVPVVENVHKLPPMRTAFINYMNFVTMS